jgi:hypothetical protein
MFDFNHKLECDIKKSLVKLINIRFHSKPFTGLGAATCGQADARVKLTGAFPQLFVPDQSTEPPLSIHT